MANPNPVIPTREQAAKGGSRGKRGVSKKTLARRLITGLAESGSDEMTLQTVQEVLQGKHGSGLRLEIAKMVIEAGLEFNVASEIARLKAQLRNKEITLQCVLKHSSQRQALELYKQLEASEKGDDEQPEEDEQEDQSQ
ncbi:hypothetical protein [Shewanella algae]|uniref:hypothetical protein n=1 Tax=Shewanella algae TaxID=38313 RepID=UPI0016555C6D|nr:hypothetical protein [Shewanella algae]MBC8795694.1 hypothetical protein [Shewanella algae]